MNSKVETEQINEIKKEDKKHLGKLIVLMILCGIGGFIGGFSSAFLKDMSWNITQNAGDFLVNISWYVPLVLSIIGSIVCYILYGNAKKLYALWNQEDEEVYSKIENNLNWILMITSVIMIICFVFMVVANSGIDAIEDKNELITKLIIFIGGIIVEIIYELVAQTKVVNFEKIINPEKKGSALDVKFQEKWMNSCDEAEQYIIYKSAFGAYKAVGTACMVLWFVCLLGATMWDFGLVPVFMLGAVWLTLVISYCYTAIKLGKNKNN